MTNCHVSLNLKNGPLLAQTITTPKAATKAPNDPEAREAEQAILLKNGFDMVHSFVLSGREPTTANVEDW